MKRQIILLSILALAACTKLEEPAPESAVVPEPQTLVMKLNASVTGFDSKPATRASESTWAWVQGDKLYITFFNGSTAVPGEAYFNSSTNSWELSVFGSLSNGDDLSCYVHYFEGAGSQTSSSVTLLPTTAVYEDTKGSYTKSADELVVYAALSPKTARIRFSGTAGSKIAVYGISYFSLVDINKGVFSTKGGLTYLTVAEDGYTPYIYGSFSSEESRLSLITQEDAFTRYCPANVLKSGKSGYMAIPSSASHNGWRTGMEVKIQDVSFNMIAVPGHQDGYFLIGETEVTQKLYHCYDAQTGTGNYPQTLIRNSSILYANSYFTQQTGLDFVLPWASQWSFAAKGGLKSQSYTYSGSNDLSEVAWHPGNCSSSQEVAKLKPNELGIYDMSGNVAELVATDGVYQNAMGGSYFESTSSHFRPEINDNNIVSVYSYYSYVGFRLCINVNL